MNPKLKIKPGNYSNKNVRKQRQPLLAARGTFFLVVMKWGTAILRLIMII